MSQETLLVDGADLVHDTSKDQNVRISLMRSIFNLNYFV